MASRTLPGIGLNGFWNLGDSWKTGGDENWLKLSALAQCVVLSATSALPGSPTDGMIYIVLASDPTNPNKIAVRDNGAWTYIAPAAGWQAFVVDTFATVRFNGTAWVSAVEAPSMRNAFVDGNFDFWSINTTFAVPAATDTYTADMWINNAGTGGAATVTRHTRTLGSELPGMARPSKYRMSHQQTTGASASPTIGQKIEGVGTFNGQSVTVSAFLQSAAPVSVVGVRAVQNFGTGGSPSAAVTTSKTVSWAVGTTEKRFSVRIDIPSISGKTLGTDSNDNLRIDLLLATGATFTLYVDQLQTEVSDAQSSSDTNGLGGAPSAFEYRGYTAEQARAQRFLEVGYAFYQAQVSSAGAFGSTVSFRTDKRSATQTLTSSNVTYSNASGLVLPVFGNNIDSINFNAAASGAGGAWMRFNWMADCRL